MLLPLFVSLVLTTVGIAIIAKVTQLAIARLGLDLYDVLEWLGLAEAPIDELAARRTGVALSNSANRVHTEPRVSGA